MSGLPRRPGDGWTGCRELARERRPGRAAPRAAARGPRTTAWSTWPATTTSAWPGTPTCVAAAAAAMKGYGLGATASRLVRGSTDVHADARGRRWPSWLGCEAALVYSSGYLANLGAVRALAGSAALVVSDAHNHASLVDGCRLAAGRTGRPAVVYRHADPGALATAVLAGRAPDGPGASW